MQKRSPHSIVPSHWFNFAIAIRRRLWYILSKSGGGSLNIPDSIEKYRAVPLETLKIYETDSLSGLLYAEFWGMVTGNARIRKCKFCGKYFIPFSENAEYCARTVPGKGKSCKGYAPMVLFRRKLAEDELQSVYAKAKAAHYMRHKRNPGLYTLEQFDRWNEQAKAALGRARREGMTAVELKMTIQSDMVW
jgi:hypothetical protein